MVINSISNQKSINFTSHFTAELGFWVKKEKVEIQYIQLKNNL